MELPYEQALYEDCLLALQTESRFYRWCMAGNKLENATSTHWKNAIAYYYQKCHNLNAEQRSRLRRHFQRYWLELNIKPSKETTVSKLDFKPVFMLNGVDVSTMSKTDIYAAIAAEEQRIAKLGEIQHKPKSLQQEISNAEHMLSLLVAHLDNN